MRTLIYKGSFAPPTIGHVAAFICAIELIKAERGIIFPGASDYLDQTNKKYMSEFFRSEKHRIHMLELAFESTNVYLDSYDYTYNREGTTAKTLEYVQKLNPKDEIYLLIGSDAMSNFPNWMYSEWILKNFSLVICIRGSDNIEVCIDANPLLQRYRDKLLFFPQPEPALINSTQVRKYAYDRDYNKMKQCLPNAVFEYIIYNIS